METTLSNTDHSKLGMMVVQLCGVYFQFRRSIAQVAVFSAVSLQLLEAKVSACHRRCNLHMDRVLGHCQPSAKGNNIKVSALQ